MGSLQTPGWFSHLFIWLSCPCVSVPSFSDYIWPLQRSSLTTPSTENDHQLLFITLPHVRFYRNYWLITVIYQLIQVLVSVTLSFKYYKDVTSFSFISTSPESSIILPIRRSSRNICWINQVCPSMLEIWHCFSSLVSFSSIPPVPHLMLKCISVKWMNEQRDKWKKVGLEWRGCV